MLDPGQAGVGQSGHVILNHRFERNVASLSGQDGADAQVQIGHGLLALVQVLKFVRESGERLHFEKRFGKIDARHQRVDLPSQFQQARGLIEFV